MHSTRWIGWVVVFCGLAPGAVAQQLAPVADPVEEPLLPSGIFTVPIHLSAERVYLFTDEDGTDAMHFLGEFQLTVGETEELHLRGKEAVAWVTTRTQGGKPHRHLQLLLWRDAEVREVGGTITTGPALFVTLDTSGDLLTHVDDIALESDAESDVYRHGNAIRHAVAERGLDRADDIAAMRVHDVSDLSSKSKKPTPAQIRRFRSSGDLKGPTFVDGMDAYTLTGGVYLSQGLAGSTNYLEIQADSVVFFLRHHADDNRETTSGGAVGLGLGGLRPDGSTPSSRASREHRAIDDGEDRSVLSGEAIADKAQAVFVEGDVVMTQGPNMIRATRIYYDFHSDRALILDTRLRASVAGREIPLYLRAAEVRQVSANRFTATDAMLTTSEFHTPHYHIGAAHIELINRTPRDPAGKQGTLRAGSFRVRHATLNIAGKPVAYWPFFFGNIDTSETAIRGIRTGYSDDFGMELETDWHFFNVLDLETPAGFDATLSLDYFTERGPAIGVDADYERDEYFGDLRSYYLTDGGKDFLGREREAASRKGTRGRFRLRHRQYLDDDWQLTLEFSHISDRAFLEEFFEREFDNDKEQETLLYLKKQRDNWALTGHLQARFLDFTTQTDRLPDFGYRLLGEPLRGGLTWFSDNRVGAVRYRARDLTFREFLRDGGNQSSGVALRADARQEWGRAMTIGPVRFVPFFTLRGTAWDDSPQRGGVMRGFATVGVRSSLYLSRSYPKVTSSLFDLDGLRHIIKPDLTAWVSASNIDPQELFPFDHTVEEIADVGGFAIGLRQRWQTKRGRGANRRKVDVFTFDFETAIFNHTPRGNRTNGFTSFSRPESSIARNYINASTIWRANDRTALLSELNYDINDGEVDILNLSLAVERTPRLSYVLGYRFIEEGDSNLLGFDLNYRLSEKHTLAVRELFDMEEGQTLDFTVVIIRRFPRWFAALSFALDEAEDDFGVSLSIWPEGIPRAAIGSRRFTGLANTTRIGR